MVSVAFTPKNARIILSAERPKILGKEGKNAPKSKENRKKAQGKRKKIKARKKEGQGRSLGICLGKHVG